MELQLPGVYEHGMIFYLCITNSKIISVFCLEDGAARIFPNTTTGIRTHVET